MKLKSQRSFAMKRLQRFCIWNYKYRGLYTYLSFKLRTAAHFKKIKSNANIMCTHTLQALIKHITGHISRKNNPHTVGEEYMKISENQIEKKHTQNSGERILKTLKLYANWKRAIKCRIV